MRWLVAFGLCSPALGAAQTGAIVAVGGGGTTDGIIARTLELAGGKKARVVVLPQSSALEGAGDSSVKMWLDAGASEAKKVDFTAPGARASTRARDADLDAGRRSEPVHEGDRRHRPRRGHQSGEPERDGRRRDERRRRGVVGMDDHRGRRSQVTDRRQDGIWPRAWVSGRTRSSISTFSGDSATTGCSAPCSIARTWSVSESTKARPPSSRTPVEVLGRSAVVVIDGTRREGGKDDGRRRSCRHRRESQRPARGYVDPPKVTRAAVPGPAVSVLNARKDRPSACSPATSIR